ncbi:hypothetical protein LY78DRAFT_307098 [Colletotrichum sublineola]|nr:hypothetical protein LY78DRAFT_307098 [Colletotrichum sublineola]
MIGEQVSPPSLGPRRELTWMWQGVLCLLVCRIDQGGKPSRAWRVPRTSELSTPPSACTSLRLILCSLPQAHRHQRRKQARIRQRACLWDPLHDCVSCQIKEAKKVARVTVCWRAELQNWRQLKHVQQPRLFFCVDEQSGAASWGICTMDHGMEKFPPIGVAFLANATSWRTQTLEKYRRSKKGFPMPAAVFAKA